MKWSRGPSHQAPTPGTAWPASCASVCPPRLDPPVPRKTTSVAPAASRCAGMTTSQSAAFGRRRLRAADHGDEETAVEQALRHPLHVGERHRIDEAVAL